MKSGKLSGTFHAFSRSHLILLRDYTLKEIELESADHHPYLGVELQFDLKWNYHIAKN